MPDQDQLNFWVKTVNVVATELQKARFLGMMRSVDGWPLATIFIRFLGVSRGR